MMILPQSFYNQKTLTVAQKLLGCFLCRRGGINGHIVKSMITETEAYCGPKDKASHASRGRTPRTEIMFGLPGFIYIYLVYGMHYMLNIVTEREGYPAAVLIRAVEVPMSLRGSRTRNASFGGRGNPVKTEIYQRDCHAPIAPLVQSGLAMKQKTNGPAKLTKFLHINKSFNGLPIFTKKHRLWIHPAPSHNHVIRRGTRIGVDYAQEYKDKLWRFYIED